MTEETIFATALGKADPADRAAYLAAACATDADLRRRVEGLLAAHDRAGPFLNRPAVNAVADATRTHGEPADDDLGDALALLAPPQRPGSLGRIGHYEVLEVLGRGGFGIVFRAFDAVLQRVVAVKVLAPSVAATSPARKRFLREARSSAAVRHDNVVQVYAVEEQPLPYLVMEFIPGETLQQRLDRSGPLDAAEVLRIGRQVAEGLAAAHEQGLIHRDIKPSNVLLDSGPTPRVKITDFGLARAADDASLTRSGAVAGTPLYMAPEQAKGDTLDHRADLFSLGSVLYALCTGRPPFRASTTLAVLKRVAEDEPRPIREVIPEVPEWLCHIVETLHAKDPAERFQSAREVADVLADCERQLQQHERVQDVSRIPAAARAAARRPARRRWWKVALIVLLLGVAAWRFGPHMVLTARNVSQVRFDVNDPEAQLILSRNGKPYLTQTGPGMVEVLPGVYDVEIRPPAGRAIMQLSSFQQTMFTGHYVPRHSPDLNVLYVGRGDTLDLTVSFKNAPPAPRPEDDGWVRLFNGTNLTGWTFPVRGEGVGVAADGLHARKGSWRVTEKGVLTGTGTGYLFSERDFTDFHLRAEVRIRAGGDSGLLFRADRKHLDAQYPVAFEAMINHTDQRNPRTGSLTDPQANYVYGTDPAVPPDTWFTYEVIAVGERITLKVNGRTTLEGQHGNARWRSGPIGLQLPGAGQMVAFRNIWIKDLSAPTAAARPPAVFGRDEVIDPLGDCRVMSAHGRLTVEVPGNRLHNLNPLPAWNDLSAPRVLRNATGDFDARVQVLPLPAPGPDVPGQGSSYVGAGLVVWVDEARFARLFVARMDSNVNGAAYAHAEWFTGGEKHGQNSTTLLAGPVHLRIQRIGGTLHFNTSSDARTWAEAAPPLTDLPLGATVRVGVAAVNTSGRDLTAIFEGLSIRP